MAVLKDQASGRYPKTHHLTLRHFLMAKMPAVKIRPYLPNLLFSKGILPFYPTSRIEKKEKSPKHSEMFSQNRLFPNGVRMIPEPKKKEKSPKE